MPPPPGFGVCVLGNVINVLGMGCVIKGLGSEVCVPEVLDQENVMANGTSVWVIGSENKGSVSDV